ncbi:MAG: hypothetical protein ACU0DW_13860 [Shimia sp.]
MEEETFNDTAQFGWSVVGEITFNGAQGVATSVDDIPLGHVARIGGPGFTAVVEAPEVIAAYQSGQDDEFEIAAAGWSGAVSGSIAGGTLLGTWGTSLFGPWGGFAGGVVGGVAGGIVGEAAMEEFAAALMSQNFGFVAYNEQSGIDPSNPDPTADVVWSTDEETGLRIRTEYRLDPVANEMVPQTVTVPGYPVNVPTGSDTDLLLGNTYPAGAVGVGNELNGLDLLADNPDYASNSKALIAA